MIKVINGKRYNTETATRISSWSNHHYPGDFHYCEETLFRTQKGAWFLHGEGGPLSSYARPVGNNGMGGGQEIRPIDEDAAYRWLEDKGEPEEIEEYFPDRVVDA